MNPYISAVLEIFKFTLPALVVFLTVYFMLKKHFETQYQLKMLELKEKINKETLPVKFQAYERLAIFCERIKLNNLYNRLNSPHLTARDLSNSMIVAIQQEYDHNVAQQLYVSSKLWEIIVLAKDHWINIISQTSERTNPNDPASVLFERLYMVLNELKDDPIHKATFALKQEVDNLIRA
jgi:hypothetical protein